MGDERELSSSLTNGGERIWIPFIVLIIGLCFCCCAPCQCLMQTIESRCCGRRFAYPVKGTPIDIDAINDGVYIKKVVPHRSSHSVSLTAELMSRKHKKGKIPPIGIDDTEVDLTCGICLESLSVGDKIAIPKTLKCNHYSFHSNCISSWLVQKNICPICRTIYIEKQCRGNQFCCGLIRQGLVDDQVLARSEICEIHGLVASSQCCENV